jgi:hypothetical protein
MQKSIIICNAQVHESQAKFWFSPTALPQLKLDFTPTGRQKDKREIQSKERER